MTQVPRYRGALLYSHQQSKPLLRPSRVVPSHECFVGKRPYSTHNRISRSDLLPGCLACWPT